MDNHQKETAYHVLRASTEHLLTSTQTPPRSHCVWSRHRAPNRTVLWSQPQCGIEPAVFVLDYDIPAGR